MLPPPSLLGMITMRSRFGGSPATHMRESQQRRLDNRYVGGPRVSISQCLSGGLGIPPCVTLSVKENGNGSQHIAKGPACATILGAAVTVFILQVSTLRHQEVKPEAVSHHTTSPYLPTIKPGTALRRSSPSWNGPILYSRCRHALGMKKWYHLCAFRCPLS